MNERPISFGPDGGLLGILTVPAEPIENAPAVLLLNAGLLHRVGPNRLSVVMARRLAGLGYTVLRFDMSGIGDSALGTTTLDIERSRDDVIAAITALPDFSKFVVMGLCTGAFNAWRAALIDDRITGCVLIDGYAYPTRRSQIQHYGARVLEGDRWVSYAKRRMGIGEDAARDVGDDMVVFENEVVSQERFGGELKTLIERQVDLLMVYTKMGPLAVTYERQLHDAFPDLDIDTGVDVLWYPNADHTFTLPGNRSRLMSDIESWLQSKTTALTERNDS